MTYLCIGNWRDVLIHHVLETDMKYDCSCVADEQQPQPHRENILRLGTHIDRIRSCSFMHFASYLDLRMQYFVQSTHRWPFN